MNSPENKNKVAIVCIGYNRINSLARLLSSLECADYPNYDIPLVLSIDGSGNEELYEFVRNYNWTHGKKIVLIHEKRLGLKAHIYKCAGLSQYFKAVILLEDDLFVSPAFYRYTEQMVDRYGENSDIAEISLYQNYINGYVGIPYSLEHIGYDIVLMQDVSTSGECFTQQMWDRFQQWESQHDEDYIQQVDMPADIKGWTRAWSKNYNAYVADTQKYVVYPNISLTTNFGDEGEHTVSNTSSIVQVNILQNSIKYRIDDTKRIAKYDLFFNNEGIYAWLGMDKDSLCLDLYGMNRELKGRRYLLSMKKRPYRVINSFGLYMRPIELNIKYRIGGNGIFLYDTSVNHITTKEGSFPYHTVTYFLNGLNNKMLFNWMKTFVIKYIKKKFTRR